MASMRSIVVGTLLVAVLCAAAAIALRHRDELPPPSLPAQPGAAAVTLDALRPQVTAFCGDCHALPSPSGFPKQAWHEEVKRGYNFYFLSERTDLSPPDFEQVVDWFRNQAPEEIVIGRQPEAPTSGMPRFRMTAIADGDGEGFLPGVSSIKWCAP